MNLKTASMPTSICRLKNNIGLTLIELMLALTLSVMLLIGIYSIFFVTKKAVKAQMSLIHLQENIRVISEMIIKDIHNAKPGEVRPYLSNERKDLTDGFVIKRKCSYFVGKTLREHPDGTVIYALYKKLFRRTKIELVEDVDDLKIKYSLLNSGVSLEKKAEEINDWSRVVGVSISFLLRDQEIKKRGYVYVAVPFKIMR